MSATQIAHDDDAASICSLTWTSVIYNRSSIQVTDLATIDVNIVILTRAPLQADHGTKEKNGVLMPGLQLVGLNGRCVVGKTANAIEAELDYLERQKKYNRNPIVLGLYGCVVRGQRPWHGCLTSLALTRRQLSGVSFEVEPRTRVVTIFRVNPKGIFAADDTKRIRKPSKTKAATRLKAGLVVTNVNGLVVSEAEEEDARKRSRRNKLHKNAIKRIRLDLTNRLIYHRVPFAKPPVLVALNATPQFQQQLVNSFQQLRFSAIERPLSAASSVGTALSDGGVHGEEISPSHYALVDHAAVIRVCNGSSSSSKGAVAQKAQSEPPPEPSTTTTEKSGMSPMEDVAFQENHNTHSPTRGTSGGGLKKKTSMVVMPPPPPLHDDATDASMSPLHTPAMSEKSPQHHQKQQESGDNVEDSKPAATSKAAGEVSSALASSSSHHAHIVQVLKSERHGHILEMELLKSTATPRLGLFLRQDITRKGNLGPVMIQSVVATGMFGATALQPGHIILTINGSPCPVTSAETFTMLYKATGKLQLQVTSQLSKADEEKYDEASLHDSASSFNNRMGARTLSRATVKSKPRREDIRRTWHGTGIGSTTR